MRVHFGEFVLDAGERVLLRAGVEQALEPKVFECLALLVAQAGKLTSMEQLRSALWPDVNVGEGALRRVINEARKALGDTGAVQSLIRTRKGLGYVFLGSVQDSPRAPTQVTQAPPAKQSLWPFVGRERELERLRAWTADSAGGLCLLSGEAGAGKSSLLAELQRQAGVRPLLAQCRATVGLPAFWPFRETAAQLMRDPALRARAVPFAQSRSQVLRAFPELADGAVAERGAEVPEQLRFELCEAFAALLCDVSQATPLWLVVEDVHWAESGSIEMLEAIARHARGQQLHVFATYRPESIEPGKALSQWIGRTSGRDGVISVYLPALGVQDVQALLRALRMPGWAGAAAQNLWQQTAGNALFLCELVRHALALGLTQEAALPPSLSHIVAQRVGTLPAITQTRLDQAAVLGHEFQLDVLAALAGVPTASELLVELEPALRAGVLRSASERGDRLQFSHALVCDALLQRLTLPERTAGHATALRALQRLHGATAPSGVLAAHAFDAGVQLASDERRLLCERAGRDAFAQLAFDRAALHLGRAVQLLDPGDSSREAAELALLWAKALLHADETEDVIEAAYLTAAESARRADLPELLAEAAIGYAVGDQASTRLRSVTLRPAAFELADEAWTKLVESTPGGVDGLHGELAYRLATAQCWMRNEVGDRADFIYFARLALRLAPPAPDPFRRRWLTALERAAEIEPGATRKAAEHDLLHAQDLDPGQRFELWAFMMGTCLTLADLEGYERAVQEIGRLVALLPQPWRSGRRGARVQLYNAIATCARVTLLVIRGQLREAEQLLGKMREQGARVGVTRATREQITHMFSMLFQLYCYQGRGSQLEPLIDRYLTTYPSAFWYVALNKVQMALERGDREAAARHYAVLRETGFRPVRRIKMLARPETLVRLADACRELGSAADAALLYEALAPRAQQCIHDGALISFGACARPLAELCVVQGRHADAEQYFQAAVQTNTKLGHQPELARTHVGFARLLLATDRPEQAHTHLHAARELATTCGMPTVLATCQQLSL